MPQACIMLGGLFASHHPINLPIDVSHCPVVVCCNEHPERNRGPTELPLHIVQEQRGSAGIFNSGVAICAPSSDEQLNATRVGYPISSLIRGGLCLRTQWAELAAAAVRAASAGIGDCWLVDALETVTDKSTNTRRRMAKRTWRSRMKTQFSREVPEPAATCVDLVAKRSTIAT